MKRYPCFFSLLLALASACTSGPAERSFSKRDGNAPPSPALGRDACGVGLDITPDTPVAMINGNPVLCSELFSFTSVAALTSEVEFREKLRTLHKDGLAALLDQKLLRAAAEAQHLSIPEFIAKTLTIAPTSEEEAKTFYREATDRGETLPEYEKIKSEIVNFLNGRKQKVALEDFRVSLRSKAKLEYRLPIVVPPVFSVEAIGESQGPETAPVTLVEFSDYDCHFCGQAEPTIRRLRKKYGDKLRLVYRDFPLPNHSNSRGAAQAAHCAGKEGKFWEMHDLLFANQGALAADKLKEYAERLALNPEQFSSCLDAEETRETVMASMQAGEKLGITGTPAFFVNGRMLSGAQSFERFVELIEYELRSL